MKQLIVLYGDQCGYCKKAKMLLKRALGTHPEFSELDVRCVSELDDEAQPLELQLIPAFFCGGRLFFEGNPDMSIVLAALRSCLEDGK